MSRIILSFSIIVVVKNIKIKNGRFQNVLNCYRNHNIKFEIDRTVLTNYALVGFSEPKWNPTSVLLMKGHSVKRRGHPPHK